MKFSPASDYTGHPSDRVKQGLVCVVHNLNDKAYLATRELQSQFFMTFEESLYMCPIGGSRADCEVHFVVTNSTLESLKMYETYIQAWVDGFNANN